MQSSDLHIEIITTREELVTDGIGTGVWVNVCTKCSAVVFDAVEHDLWHLGEVS